MANPHANEPLNNLSVRKSNEFVTARYSSSLLENQIMAISLTRIENTIPEDSNSPLIARLYPGELKRLVSDPAHIYRDLKVVANRMTGHNFFIEDGKGNFHALAIITNADYVNGIFTIKFNDELRGHILGLEKNYTTFELSVMTDFKKNSSFRLYEVLKKEIYKIKTNDFQSSTQVEYNISELRFIIGLANSDDQRVKNAFSRKNTKEMVDWDELYAKLDKKDKKYEEWRDFQRRVLKPAQDELEEKSDIRFEYEGIREGRKINRLLFTIYRNIPNNTEVIDEKVQFIEEKKTKYRQHEFPMDMPEYADLYDEYVGHNNLARQDIDTLLIKAGYDKERVKNAIVYADKQEEIRNYMGFLIRCIENDYTSTSVVQGSNEMYEVITELQKESHTDTVAQSVWDKAKRKEDFPDFMAEMLKYGLDLEALEAIYSCAELNKAYIDYKVGRPITLFE